MSAQIPRKVPYRTVLTGDANSDRMQRMAQQVGQAHEITKSTVDRVANTTSVSLATDVTIGVAAYADVLSTTFTMKGAGQMDISFSASAVKTLALGTLYFQVLVDGVAYHMCWSTWGPGYAINNSARVRVSANAGTHTVVLQWKTDVNNVRCNAVTVSTECLRMFITEVP